MARHWKLRAASLLAAGAYGLHQLRYVIAYGGDAHHELAAQGHAYLTFAPPLLAVVLVLCLAEIIRRAARRRMEGPAPVRLSLLWASATACLVVAYAVQELLESALSPGHPGGLAGMLEHGGWVALPLALAFGLVVALVLRGATRAIELVDDCAVRLAPPRALLLVRSFGAPRRAMARILARYATARAPPVPSV